MTSASELNSSANYLKSFLEQNPDKAIKVALSHYRRWKTLETRNALLEAQNMKLKADNSLLLKRCESLLEANLKLKYVKSSKSPSLRKLLNSKKS